MAMAKKLVAQFVMWLLGWRVECPFAPPPKCIVVGHPHTSTWDFPLFVLTLWVLKIDMRWIGKQSLFEGPFGWLFRALGGLPVDRTGGKNTVQSVTELFAAHDELRLGIAPSGTRDSGDHWRSGFYHMAKASNVPLVLGSIDFKRRAGRFIGVLDVGGDLAADMDRIRAMYEGVEGRNPERQIEIRLMDERSTAHSPQNK